MKLVRLGTHRKIQSYEHCGFSAAGLVEVGFISVPHSQVKLLQKIVLLTNALFG